MQITLLAMTKSRANRPPRTPRLVKECVGASIGIDSIDPSIGKQANLPVRAEITPHQKLIERFSDESQRFENIFSKQLRKDGRSEEFCS